MMKINKNWLLSGLLAVMLVVAGWQYGQVRQQIELQATGVCQHSEQGECEAEEGCKWIVRPGQPQGGSCVSEPDEPNPSASPVPSASPALLCAIQGRKVIMPGNLRIEPASSQTVTLAGNGTSATNPYYFVGIAAGNKTVSVTTPAGYTVGYTLCINDINCHNNTPTPGSSVTFDCPAGNYPANGYADLYWHYTPVPNPSVSPYPSASPAPNPSVSPNPSASVSPVPNPSVSPYPSASPAPSVSPNPNPSVSPAPSVSPSPRPSASPLLPGHAALVIRKFKDDDQDGNWDNNESSTGQEWHFQYRISSDPWQDYTTSAETGWGGAMDISKGTKVEVKELEQSGWSNTTGLTLIRILDEEKTYYFDFGNFKEPSVVTEAEAPVQVPETGLSSRWQMWAALATLGIALQFLAIML